jgi:YidC/Oxa1 family membrane protein insertase
MASIFTQILVQPFFNLFMAFVALFPGPNVALAIVAMTVVTRLLVWPLNKKSIVAQKKMQALQPELERIRELHKGDQATTAKETMALYQRHGASPVSGCLFSLVQLPFLLVLFAIFKNINRPELLYSFTPDPSHINPYLFGIDLTAPERWIFPAFAALSFLLVSIGPLLTQFKVIRTKGLKDPQALITLQMSLIFPVMTFFFARSLPAALSMYWALSSLLIAFQQWWVGRGVVLPQVSVTVSKKKEKR